MSKSVPDAPAAVVATAKDMLRRGLAEGTAGNISARQEDGTVVITPSSVDYDEMTLEDLVVVHLDGEVVTAKEGRSPSSEKLLHLSCLPRLRRHRLGHPFPPGLRHDVRGRPSEHPGVHRRVHVGPRPDKVLHITALVERNAQIVFGARLRGGIHELPETVNRQFAGYYGYMRQS